MRAIAAHFYLQHSPLRRRQRPQAVESFPYSGGVNSLGFYSLANFYYRRRPEYIEMLDRARFVHDGDLTEFVQFALRGLREELEDVHAEALEFVGCSRSPTTPARRCKCGGLRSKTGARRLDLVLQLTGEPVPIVDLRARLLYAGVHSDARAQGRFASRRATLAPMKPYIASSLNDAASTVRSDCRADTRRINA